MMISLYNFLELALAPNVHQRKGQYFMTVLYEHNPSLYTLISRTCIDPFYVDDNLFAAIDIVKQNWY